MVRHQSASQQPTPSAEFTRGWEAGQVEASSHYVQPPPQYVYVPQPGKAPRTSSVESLHVPIAIAGGLLISAVVGGVWLGTQFSTINAALEKLTTAVSQVSASINARLARIESDMGLVWKRSDQDLFCAKLEAFNPGFRCSSQMPQSGSLGKRSDMPPVWDGSDSWSTSSIDTKNLKKQ